MKCGMACYCPGAALRLIELKFANSFMYSRVARIYRRARVIERVIIRRSTRAKLHFCNLLNVPRMCIHATIRLYKYK